MTTSSSVDVDVLLVADCVPLAELVQFSAHCGVGVAAAPGNGTSPASALPDTQIASREIAKSFLIACTPVVSLRSGGSIPLLLEPTIP